MAASTGAASAGTIRLVCTIVSGADLRAGNSVTVEGRASLFYMGTSNATNATATVKKSAASQTVTLNLPFRWALAGSPGGSPVTVTVTVTPSLTYPARNSASTSLSIALPANGATTVVAVPVRL